MAARASGGPVVVVGGGIIGASIAYHLTLRGLKPTLIEGTSVAAAASGKAGGFLAGGWGEGSPTQQLHRVSFAMHAELAKTLGVESYRRLPTMSVAGGINKGGGKSKGAVGAVPWLDGNVRSCSVMDADTAQVTPKELTEKLVAAALANGAQLLEGQVQGIVSEEGEGGTTTVTGVQLVGGETVPAARVVFALGPWSVLLERWLPGQHVPMQGVKSTSVVFAHPPASVAPFALFCEEDRNGCHLEVYPRPNGEVYMCGVGGSEYLEAEEIAAITAKDVHADPSRVAAAKASFEAISSLGSPPVSQSQACMRPLPPDGMPLLGALPHTSNAFIAAGHNCWGILWAPATGLAMAELLVDGESKSIDLQAFDPGRFVPGRKRRRHAKAGQEHVG